MTKLIKIFKQTFRSFITQNGNDIVCQNNFYITLK